MKTIIAGSRSITSYLEFLFAIADARKAGIGVSEVVSGTARGVDTMGEEWGEEVGVPVTRFPADWKAYGKSAGYRRNVQMADYADALIAIWDGKSRGTKHMIDIAAAKGLKTHIHIPKQP